MSKPYPWQIKQWQQLNTLRSRHKLPHALILTGQQGLGLDAFAYRLAQSLLCEQIDDDGFACGSCASCRAFQSEAHPDYHAVTVEEDKSQISIDQIRQLQTFIQLSQSGGGSKVVIISPADAMNINAANSLLKSLEEPPGNAVLILVSHQLDRLPATIRSRCQQISFPRPTSVVAEEWLTGQGYTQASELLLMAQGAPCLAVELNDLIGRQAYQQMLSGLFGLLQGKQRVATVSEQWSKIPPELLVEWQLSVIRDLIRAASSLEIARFENQNQVQHLQNTLSRVDLEQLFNVYDQLIDLYRRIDSPLNPELLRERMILFWMQWSHPDTNR